jgi:solute carrier family 25 S-adenosylmethionine transporter 26
MVGRESKIRESLRNIYSMKGLRGFYTGYAPTLLRDISFSAIQMPLFEHLKPLIGGALGLHQEDPKICSISGSTSAFISAFLTCPFDVIKTRHQTMRMTEENVSISKVVKDILLEEGYRGLWKGVSIRCLILTIGGLFYFYSFGKAKNLLQVVHT